MTLQYMHSLSKVNLYLESLIASSLEEENPIKRRNKTKEAMIMLAKKIEFLHQSRVMFLKE